MTEPQTSAVVRTAAPRRLSGKRGRPSSSEPRQSTDLGTPELIYKRLCHVTTEPLDLCLERQLITADQHWCGLHLRWLHTLRYGLPGVKAVDTTHLGGREMKPEDPEWRSSREKEYLDAITLLRHHRLMHTVIDICIHNAPLSSSPALPLARHSGGNAYRLVAGLTLLTKCWCG